MQKQRLESSRGKGKIKIRKNKHECKCSVNVFSITGVKNQNVVYHYIFRLPNYAAGAVSILVMLGVSDVLWTSGPTSGTGAALTGTALVSGMI